IIVEKIRQKTTTFFSLILPFKKGRYSIMSLGFFLTSMDLNPWRRKRPRTATSSAASISPFFTSFFFVTPSQRKIGIFENPFFTSDNFYLDYKPACIEIQQVKISNCRLFKIFSSEENRPDNNRNSPIIKRKPLEFIIKLEASTFYFCIS